MLPAPPATSLHLGLHVGRTWSAAVIQTGAGDGPMLNWSAEITRASGQPRPLAQLIQQARCRAGTVETTEHVFLLDDPGDLQLLPGDGRAAASERVTVSTWEALVDNNATGRALHECLWRWIRAIVARLEESTGLAALPAAGGVTVAVDPSAPAAVVGELPRAIRRALGAGARFLWQPVAASGLTLLLPEVGRALRGGQPLRLAVAHGGELRHVHVHLDRGTVTTRIAQGGYESAAYAGFEPPAAAQAAALGAAAWGVFHEAAAAPAHRCTSPVTFCLQDESDPVDLPAVELRPPPDATAGPDAPAESPGGGGAPAAFARAVGVGSSHVEPVALHLAARFPWSPVGYQLVRQVVSAEDTINVWRRCFAGVVVLSPDESGGEWTLARTDRGGRISRRFVLLPPSDTAPPAQAADGHDRPGGPDQPPPLNEHVLEEIRGAFAHLPQFDPPTWRPDPDAGIAALSGADGGTLTDDRAYELSVLYFGKSQAPLGVTTEPPGYARTPTTTVEQIHPTLHLHRFVLKADRDGQPPPEGLRVRWMLRAPGRRHEAAEAGGGGATRPLLEGTVHIGRPGHGVVGHIDWDDGGLLPDYPVPVGAARDARGLTVLRPMPTGLAGVRHGVFVARPPAGRLRLHNTGKSPVRVELSPAGPVRVFSGPIRLEPGEHSTLPIQLRRSAAGRGARETEKTNGDTTPPAAPRELVATVWAEGEGGRAPTPPAAVTFRWDGPAGATKVLPPEHTIRLDLPMYIADGSWTCPVEVAGRTGARLVLAPALQRDAGVDCLVAAEPAHEGSARRARLAVLCQPLRLLEWFPGPVDQIAGRLEVHHPAESGRELVVELPVAARLVGAASVVRELHVESTAGAAGAAVLPILQTDKYGVTSVSLEWHNAPPYELKARLTRVPAAPASGPAPVPAPGDAIVREGRVLPPGAVAANRGLIQPVRLELQPARVSGWESGRATGTLRLHRADGRAQDAITLHYEARPATVSAEVGLIPLASTGAGSYRLEVAVRNDNKTSAVTLRGLSLRLAMRPGVFGKSLEVDVPRLPAEPLTLRSGESRVLTGEARLRGGLFRRLRGWLLRRGWADVELDLIGPSPNDPVGFRTGGRLPAAVWAEGPRTVAFIPLEPRPAVVANDRQDTTTAGPAARAGAAPVGAAGPDGS